MDVVSEMFRIVLSRSLLLLILFISGYLVICFKMVKIPIRIAGFKGLFQPKMSFFQGVAPSKTFGEASKAVLQKDVYITASGKRDVATFAGGNIVIFFLMVNCS